MTAADLLWWVRLATDIAFVLCVLNMVIGNMAYRSGARSAHTPADWVVLLDGAFALAWLLSYPYWLRPLLTAAIGGAP